MRLLTILLFFSLAATAQNNRKAMWMAVMQPAPSACSGVPVVSDADAQKFLCAAKISGQTIGNAINQLVISLKDSGFWSNMVGLYPMVSDNILATRQYQTAYNLKDTANYNIVWTDGTFASTGVIPSHGNTGIVPSTTLQLNSVALGYYSRTNNTTSGTDWDAFGGTYLRIYINQSAGNAYNYINSPGATSNATIVAHSGTQGMFISTRTSSTTVSMYKNGSLLGTATKSSTSLPTTSLHLGGRYSVASGLRECAGAFVYNGGMTAAQAASISTIINTFNTSISRNVY